MPNNKNWIWDDHKYKSREWVKGRWKYTYDAIKNTTNKVKETAEEVKNKASNIDNKNIRSKVDDAKKAVQSIFDKVDNLTKKVKETSLKIAPFQKSDNIKINAINTKTPNDILQAIVKEEYTTKHDIDTKDKLKLKDSKYRDVDQVTITDKIVYRTEDKKTYSGAEFYIDSLGAWSDSSFDAMDIISPLLHLTGTIIPVAIGWDIYRGIYNSWVDKKNKELIEQAHNNAFQDRQRDEVPKLIEEMAKEKRTPLDDISKTADDIWNTIKNKFSNDQKTVDQLYEAANDDRETKYINLTDKQKAKLMDSINPNFDPYDLDDGWEYNCSSCSLAWDLNNRGIDAKAVSANNMPPVEIDEISKWYKDAKVVEFGNYTDLYNNSHENGYSRNEIADIISTVEEIYPEGSCGHIDLLWAPPGMVGGHALIFEIENGEMIMRDAQSHEIYRSENSKDYDNRTYSIEELLEMSGYISMFRSDNLELDDSYKKYVKI